MKVKLTGEYIHMADGQTEIEVYDTNTIRGLFNALESVHPTGQWQYSCVAVNGTMYQDAWSTEINANDEVVIMPAIGGG
tara:strand:+ start:95 stop:331 length:237 start_codon:yes stop_codon:yes gene_type:complete